MKKKEEKKDLWKAAVQKKLTEDPVYTTSDARIWQNVLSEIENTPRRKVSISYGWYAAAATVLLVLSITFGIFLTKQPNITAQIDTEIPTAEKAKDSEIRTKVLVTEKEPAKKKSVTAAKIVPVKKASFSLLNKTLSAENILTKELKDGSTVTLNKNSELLTDDHFGENRNVKLTGEAFFEVVPDKNRPFTVYFGKAHLVVVGTKFNVRNRKNEDYYEITVTEGIVKVFTENNSQPYEVKKGQQLVIDQVNKAVFTQADVQEYIRWKTADYDFKASRLREVAVALSRKYGQRISVENSISGCRFSGDLDGLTLEESLTILKLSNNLIIKKEKEEIYISGNTCE